MPHAFASLNRGVRSPSDSYSFEQILAAASKFQEVQAPAVLQLPQEDEVSKDLNSPELRDLVSTQEGIQLGSLSLDAVLLRISALAMRVTRAEGAGVWLFDRDVLGYRAGTGTASNSDYLRKLVLSRVLNNTSGCWTESSGQAADQDFVKSLCVAPVLHGKAVAGALAVFCRYEHPFNERDITSIRLLTSLLTQALDKAADAQFKTTVKIERAAMLNAIETLVPAIEELLETKPGNLSTPGIPPRAALGEAIVPSFDDAPLGGMELRDLETLLGLETQTKQTPISLPGETDQPTKSASDSPRDTFRNRDAPFVGMADFEHRSRAAHSATIKSPCLQHLPSVERIVLCRSSEWEATRPRISTKLINLIQTSASWYQTTRSTAITYSSEIIATIALLKNYLVGDNSSDHWPLTFLSKFAVVVAVPILPLLFIMNGDPSQVRPVMVGKSPPPQHKQGSDRATLRSHKCVTDSSADAALSESSPFEFPILFRKASFGDDATAFMIGMAYETGRGLPQSCAKAARWVKHAAAGGNAAAEYNLSLRFRDGDGVTADPVEAQRLLRQAVAQHYAQALQEPLLLTPNISRQSPAGYFK